MKRALREAASIFATPLLRAMAGAGHMRALMRARRAVPLPAPVCSVGNISFGGTCKTPMVQYLAEKLSELGLRPGVVLRGWQGRIDRSGGPPAVVSDGERVFRDWTDSGDEAALLAQKLIRKKVPIVVGRDRLEACQLLLSATKSDTVILDDGFQYTGLARDADILLIDLLCPFGRYDCYPGPLREPVSSVRRADMIVLTRKECVDSSRMQTIRRVLERQGRNLPPVYTAASVVTGIRDGTGGRVVDPSQISGSRVFVLSGIGNPLSFRKTIESIGCKIAGAAEFPDHHVFTRRELAAVWRRARAADADAVVTTTKDAVRINGQLDGQDTIPLKIVEIRLSIDREQEFLESCMRLLSDGWRQRKNRPVED